MSAVGKHWVSTLALKACCIAIWVAGLSLPIPAIGEGADNQPSLDKRGWDRLTEEQLSEKVVSVFHWKDDVFATYDTRGYIELIDTVSGESLRRIVLAEAPLPSGEIYPDPLSRTGDRIVHLNKAGPELRFYDLSGKLQGGFPLATRSAYWVDKRSNLFWVLGVDPHSELTRLAAYSQDGRLLKTVEPWLRPKAEHWRAGAAFFFLDDGERWELPFFFPFVSRTDSQASRGRVLPILDYCGDDLSESVRDAFQEQAKTYGAPEPIGTGLRESPQLNPVILAASRTDSEILLLLNGGVFASIDLTSGAVRCERLPRPGSEAGWVATSIAAHEDRVVIMFRTPQTVDVRVLVRQRNESSTPQTKEGARK